MKDLLLQADVAFSRVYKDYRKLMKSFLVGVVATLTDMAILFLIINNTELWYLFAAIVSYHCGMVVSFILNKTFTFKNTYDKYHYQFMSFALVAYSQLILTTALLYLIVEQIFGSDTSTYVMIAKLMVSFVGFVYAFIVNKSLTFKIFK